MDISGLVVTSLGICFEVASTLYSYGKQVKGARKDIQNLSNELFGLIGALEHLKIQQEHKTTQESSLLPPPNYEDIDIAQTKTNAGDGSADKTLQENVYSVLRQTFEFLQELQQSLREPKGRLNATLHLMKWPLRESEVQRHLGRLERVKTYFILLLVTDEVEQSRKAADEIVALRTMIQHASLKQQDIELRKLP